MEPLRSTNFQILHNPTYKCFHFHGWNCLYFDLFFNCCLYFAVFVFHHLWSFRGPLRDTVHCRQHSVHGSRSSRHGPQHQWNASKRKLCMCFTIKIFIRCFYEFEILVFHGDVCRWGCDEVDGHEPQILLPRGLEHFRLHYRHPVVSGVGIVQRFRPLSPPILQTAPCFQIGQILANAQLTHFHYGQDSGGLG